MNSELARRIAFTLGALLIYRLGTYIPVPGTNYISHLPGISPSFAPLTIFSIGILPYVYAAILIQMVSMAWSGLNTLGNSGEAGRRRTARYTLGLATFLAAFQAHGIGSGLQNIPGFVSDPGGIFVISVTITLTGGTIFLIWLSEQMTERGIGNGLALILFTGVVTRLPQEVASVVELTRQGALTVERAGWLTILWAAFVGLVVFVELARRRVPVEFAARNLGNRSLPARSTDLSFKLNHAGLVPMVVAPWLFSLLLVLASLVLARISPSLVAAYERIQLGHVGQTILASVAIFIFAFIYTAFVVDPERAADSLMKRGGVIPGIMPGEPTAEHLDRVVSRTTFVGAIYLAAIFLIPEVLIVHSQLPFYLGGTSVLIVVCAILDIETQVRGMSRTGPGGAYS